MRKVIYLILVFSFLFSASCKVLADTNKPLTGEVSDPLVEAQEKLMYAKGSYKTVKDQLQAIKHLRKATRLSLKAAKLRASAEKLQSKADILVNKANQQALTRGLYITSPLSPVMMQPPLQAQQRPVSATSIVPIPGQPVNIIVPRNEEVSYDESSPDGY
jgi:hypothetical protein